MNIIYKCPNITSYLKLHTPLMTLIFETLWNESVFEMGHALIMQEDTQWCMLFLRYLYSHHLFDINLIIEQARPILFPIYSAFKFKAKISG